MSAQDTTSGWILVGADTYMWAADVVECGVTIGEEGNDVGDQTQERMTELTSERLAEIRGRLATATPGPWEVDEDDGCIYEVDGEIRAPVPVGRMYRDEDLELLVHAPADLAALLAEVERLRAELAAARQDVADLREAFGWVLSGLGWRDGYYDWREVPEVVKRLTTIGDLEVGERLALRPVVERGGDG